MQMVRNQMRNICCLFTGITQNQCERLNILFKFCWYLRKWMILCGNDKDKRYFMVSIYCACAGGKIQWIYIHCYRGILWKISHVIFNQSHSIDVWMRQISDNFIRFMGYDFALMLSFFRFICHNTNTCYRTLFLFRALFISSVFTCIDVCICFKIQIQFKGIYLIAYLSVFDCVRASICSTQCHTNYIVSYTRQDPVIICTHFQPYTTF